MKKFFQQYSYTLLKNASPNGDPAQYEEKKLIEHLNRIAEKHPGRIQEEDARNVVCTTNTEYWICHKKLGNHIFIDKETEKVIINAIRKLDNKTLARYTLENDIGIIYRAKKDPILFNTANTSKGNKSAMTNTGDLGILRVDAFGKTDWSNRTIKSGLSELQDTMRFVYGCFMMRECFPQVFKEGLPDYVKHPAWFKHQKNSSISINRVSHEVCPHIRVGHFRLLSSERYVNKRGQVIFVKPSMVKGHATHTELKELNES